MNVDQGPSGRFGPSSVARTDWIRPQVQPQSTETFESVWASLPPEIKEQFGSNGTTNRNKLEIFKYSIESLLEQYGLGKLIMMSEECVCCDGRIELNKLNEIIEDENGSSDF